MLSDFQLQLKKTWREREVEFSEQINDAKRLERSQRNKLTSVLFLACRQENIFETKKKNLLHSFKHSLRNSKMNIYYKNLRKKCALNLPGMTEQRNKSWYSLIIYANKGHTQNRSFASSHIQSHLQSHSVSHAHEITVFLLTLPGRKPEAPQTAIITSLPPCLSAGSLLHVVKLNTPAVWPPCCNRRIKQCPYWDHK